MNEKQASVLAEYQIEMDGLVQQIDVGADGEHLWSNYERVTATIFRLTEMHNEIAMMEIYGQDWPELKKFRTLIVDSTKESLEKVAAFESRKITGQQIEKDLER